MSDDLITIETPEHIEVHYELAGIGSRALAGIFDFLLQAILTVIVVGGLYWLGLALKIQGVSGVIGGVIIGTLGFVAFTVYYVLSEMLMAGQSPGKRIAGMRVISVDGRPITFLQSALRNIIRVVDMFPSFYTVGLVTVFFSARGQRLGDMVAGTMVVKERLHELPAHTAALEATPTPRPAVPPELEARLRTSMHALTSADIAAAERLLDRRHELQPAVRVQLTQQVADSLLARMPHAQATDFPDRELVLEAIVRLWHERPL